MLTGGWGLWLVAPGSMRAAISRRIRRPPVGRVSVSKDLMGEDSPSILLRFFLFFQGGLQHVIAVNPGSNPVDLDSSRSGKENNIRAFPSRF